MYSHFFLYCNFAYYLRFASPFFGTGKNDKILINQGAGGSNINFIMEVTIMKKLSVLLLTIIACCMLWACGKTATFNESEEETTTHKKNKTEYSTTAEDVTESFERQTYSDSDYKTGITFDNISRNPKDYEGKLVYFTGEVVQLMEGDDENQIRLAVDGDYDKVILIGYDPEITTSRILEDDNIEIYGTSVGIFQYESVLGQTISIPAVYVDKINLINGNQITPNEPVNQPAKQPVEQPAEQPAKQPTEQPAPPATKPAAQSTTPASNVSAGESNALKSAKSYLDMGGFSKESLKGQLEYEGYDANQIQYALDNCGADWKEQALESAKSYLSDDIGFSKLGLMDQLEYEKFTSEEIQYAIDNCGGDWMAQAVIKAQSYMESVPMSRDELISQLEYEKFTHEEAVHGVDAVGL